MTEKTLLKNFGFLTDVSVLKNKPECVILKFNNAEVLIAYGKFICAKTPDGKIYLSREYWNWNKNVSRFRNIFLNKTNTEFLQEITKNKNIVFVDKGDEE